jgi:hypothetical protein
VRWHARPPGRSRWCIGYDEPRRSIGNARHGLAVYPARNRQPSLHHLFRLYCCFVITLDIAPGVYPNLSRHFDRMMARPAVQHVLAAEAAVGYNMSLGFLGGENR